MESVNENVPAPVKKETRGRKKLPSCEHLSEISFEYKGETYTIYKDRDKNGKHLSGGHWNDPEFCRLYGRHYNRIKPKKIQQEHCEKQKPRNGFCLTCKCTIRSKELHEQTQKHKRAVAMNDLFRKQAIDYLKSCGYSLTD